MIPIDEYQEKGQITSDGKTVWVNSMVDGMNIGRFSKRGVDVHHETKGQEKGLHCIDCSPGPTTLDDWKRFQNAMLIHHGVSVQDHHKPEHLRVLRETIPQCCGGHCR